MPRNRGREKIGAKYREKTEVIGAETRIGIGGYYSDRVLITKTEGFWKERPEDPGDAYGLGVGTKGTGSCSRLG